MNLFSFLRGSCGVVLLGFWVVCNSRNLVAGELSLVPFARDEMYRLKPFRKGSSLLVALQPYLGRRDSTPNQLSANEFRLVSLNQPITLRDSSGLIHKATEINLTWRKVLLNKPIIITRQVSRPYASFESAEMLVEKLKKLGIPSLVAHPKDWEVWISTHQELPKDFEFEKVRLVVSHEIKPFLKGTGGGVELLGPIQINAPGGLRWKDGMYKGPFWLKPDSYGTWSFIEEVPLEDYLKGVVPYEIGASAPLVALEVQAVLARTWAIANSHRFAIDGYHLCSDTQCQVYKDPSKVNKHVKRAIKNTTGKILSWNNKPISAVYHASNGGVMASLDEAWFMDPVPYLRTKLDGTRKWNNQFKLPLKTNSNVELFLKQKYEAYGNDHSRFRWSRTINTNQLRNVLNKKSADLKSPFAINVLERGNSGRVVALEIRSKSKPNAIVLRLDNIRRTLRNLPSTLFVVNREEEGTWKFLGGGFGHGVGLSQAGAIDLASKGWTLEEILMHYYPGTTYGSLPDFSKEP